MNGRPSALKSPYFNEKNPRRTEKKSFNPTLGTQDQVLINVYAGRGSSYIPTSHTCSFELELSADYENFTVFEQSLRIYLEHALAGSGFQFE